MFFKSSFLKNVTVLITGTVIAQLITIIVAPILGRIYTPEDFGFYGFYLSLTGIISIIVTGRYEMAIFITGRKEKATYVFNTAIIITFLVSSLALLISIVFLLLNKHLSAWYYGLSFSILASGIIQTITIFANYEKRYKLISNNAVLRSLIANTIFILLGFLGFGISGLMIGLIVGQIIQVLHFFFYLKIDLLLNNYNYRVFKSVVSTYKNFLKFSTLSSFINSLSIQLPVLFLKSFFSQIQVGHYFQSYKLLTLPNSVIAKSIGSVFVQKASEHLNNNESISDFVIKLYKKLILISFLPYSILLVFGDIIITFVLGNQWSEAGIYAQIISPWIYINFIVIPFTYLFEILQKQKLFTILNTILIIARGLSLLIGFYFQSVYYSIFLFSISSFIIYGVILFFIFKLAKIKGILNHCMYIIFYIISVLILILIRYSVLG